MNKNSASLQGLFDKVKSGKSTPEEDLALLRFLNDSMQVYLALVQQLKAVKAKRSPANQ